MISLKMESHECRDELLRDHEGEYFFKLRKINEIFNIKNQNYTDNKSLLL